MRMTKWFVLAAGLALACGFANPDWDPEPDEPDEIEREDTGVDFALEEPHLTLPGGDEVLELQGDTRGPGMCGRKCGGCEEANGVCSCKLMETSPCQPGALCRAPTCVREYSCGNQMECKLPCQNLAAYGINPARCSTAERRRRAGTGRRRRRGCTSASGAAKNINLESSDTTSIPRPIMSYEDPRDVDVSCIFKPEDHGIDVSKCRQRRRSTGGGRRRRGC